MVGVEKAVEARSQQIHALSEPKLQVMNIGATGESA